MNSKFLDVREVQVKQKSFSYLSYVIIQCKIIKNNNKHSICMFVSVYPYTVHSFNTTY